MASKKTAESPTPDPAPSYPPPEADGIPYEIDGRSVCLSEYVAWQREQERNRILTELAAPVTDDATDTDAPA